MVNVILGDTDVLAMAYFPHFMEGSAVYYTLYNQDTSLYAARTAAGIIDFGKGAYGVDVSGLFTDPGEYVITFDIDASYYFATDDIKVQGRDSIRKEFVEYNADKSVKKVRIKHSQTGNFSDIYLEKELTFEYNVDGTVSKMDEVVI